MPTFPALDEEPPPRPVWQVLVMVTAGIAVVAAVVVVAVEHPWVGTPGRASVAAAPRPGLQDVGGRLLVLDFKTGELGYTTPSGGHFDPLAGQSLIGDWALLSPDETAAVTSFGQVVRIHGRQVQNLLLRPSGSWAPTLRPWADHGRRLVLMTVGGGHAEVRTVDVHGDHGRALGGGAADAVGDPTRDGALVLVAGRNSVNLGEYSELPTVRLELRTAGRQSLFATTAGLAVQIGLPPKLPYRVAARFSPDGSMVAIALDQLTPGGSGAHGMIVLTRGATGVYSAKSPHPVWTSWSPDGRSLAFGSGGTVELLDVTDPRAVPQQVTVGRADLTPCLWSPSGAALLCDDYHAGRRYVVDVAGRKVTGPIQLKPDNRYALAWQAGKAA